MDVGEFWLFSQTHSASSFLLDDEGISDERPPLWTVCCLQSLLTCIFSNQLLIMYNVVVIGTVCQQSQCWD